MSAYGPLARWYDELTRDVPYGDFAAYYVRVFAEYGLSPRLVLDLGCGTGTLACLLAARGYELIAADASAEMLTAAREKALSLPAGAPQPLFIRQRAETLDLFGTVDAAVSSLDSLSYVSPEKLPEAFRRLRLFLRPGGVLAFDMRTPAFLRGMDGSLSVDETAELLCLWRGRFDGAAGALRYDMDLFSREGRLWRREGETHVEYAHEPARVEALLRERGFTDIRRREDGPMGGAARVYFTARRGEDT